MSPARLFRHAFNYGLTDEQEKVLDTDFNGDQLLDVAAGVETYVNRTTVQTVRIFLQQCN